MAWVDFDNKNGDWLASPGDKAAEPASNRYFAGFPALTERGVILAEGQKEVNKMTNIRTHMILKIY